MKDNLNEKKKKKTMWKPHTKVTQKASLILLTHNVRGRCW